MILKIDYLSGVPSYQQIKDAIKEEIALGRMSPMDELPSVRKLADQIKVNPNTVARAYRDLISEGILFSRQGMGYYVRPAEHSDWGGLEDALSKLVISARVRNISSKELLDKFSEIVESIYQNEEAKK